MVACGRMRANGKGLPLLQAALTSGASEEAVKLPAKEAKAFKVGTRTGAAAVSVSLRGTERLLRPLTHNSNARQRRPKVKKLPATPRS